VKEALCIAMAASCAFVPCVAAAQAPNVRTEAPTAPATTPAAAPATTSAPAPSTTPAAATPDENTAATALPPGHPPLDTAAPGANADAMPAGHPPIGDGAPAGPHGAQRSEIRQMELPETGTAEAPDLPAGVILARVVDANGNPLPNVPVRLGIMREGEQQAAREATTRADGIAQFDHLETGTTIAYRASTEVEGARFGAPPFNLPSNAGYHVQIVRFPVTHDPRAILITEARVEMQFAEDRLIVAEHVSLVNFSSMSIGGMPPRPEAFVPANGLRFQLPAGATAFRADQTMGDQHITEENGVAILRGSIPPTGASDHIDLAFQYRVRYEGNRADLELSLPLPVLRGIVGTHAAPGMQLTVEGMGPAEERIFNGQRVLVTGRERTSRDDAALDHLRIRIENIPSSAGPERTGAAVAALAISLGAIAFGLRNERGRKGNKPRARPLPELEAERDRLLETARRLAREHAAGDLGPETFARRRREVSMVLASVLKEIAQAKTSSESSAKSSRAKSGKRS
jgi:hypothetical protein